MKEDIKFSMVLPGELTEKQIETLLPLFILMQEKQNEEPRVSNSREINVSVIQQTRTESGDWSVNGDWFSKAKQE